MKTNLQAMRKRAGFKSAKAFADHIGMNVGTYTNYEQGTRTINLEVAWELADKLDCTLDELAGREPPPVTYTDHNQAALNGYYESMNEDGRSALVESARLMSGSPDVRIEKDGAEDVRLPPAMGA